MQAFGMNKKFVNCIKNMFLFYILWLQPHARHAKMQISVSSGRLLLQAVHQTGQDVFKQDNRPPDEKVRHIMTGSF